MPLLVRLAVALALPFIAALTVGGTYFGQEVIVAAAWVAIAVVGALFLNPVMGILVMTALYLLSAYPTLLQELGFLTISNLIGVGFLVLFAAHVLNTRDLSFLRVPQVRILALIGVVFLFSTSYAPTNFPLLRATRGRVLMLDRTSDFSHDYVTRLAFLVFFLTFVRTRRDIRLVFLVFMFSLYIAVPSALLNWLQGNLKLGFRAAASVTAGSNANKLAMICLMEIACWWFWSLSRPGGLRRMTALGAIGAALLILLATGSRSGFLGTVVLAGLLQTGARHYRLPMRHLLLAGFVSFVIIATVVPQAAVDRMTNLTGSENRGAANSNKMRADTVYTAMAMVRDHPLLGIGLGNFREVSRQVYNDAFFRPPHNSYLWAASEGGLVVLALYLLLFWVTWRDLVIVARLAHRDPELGYVAAAFRAVYVLYCVFALFADLWMSPFTYIFIGEILCLRRHMESLPEPAAVTVAPRGWRRVAAAA
jgi:O-antigen ligase